MKYKLTEIFDIEELKRLCESFTNLNGTAIGIVDLEGKVLIESGYLPICTQFHRVHQETRKRCIESDTILASQLEPGKKYNIYKCKNGLNDVAMPIIIGDEHIGNLFTGQFLDEVPDIAYFKKKAREFGFDEAKYLTEVEKVPVFNADYIEKLIVFLLHLTEIIGGIGLKRLQNIEYAKQLELDKEALELLNKDLILAKLSVEEREERFRLMIKNSNDSFVLINDKGVQFYISDAAMRDTGFTSEELKGPIQNVIYPDDWETVSNAWNEVISNKGAIVRVQYRHKHKYKEYIWYEAVSQNFLDNPAIRAVVVNVRDITTIKENEIELKQSKEKAEESDRLKTAFLQNMSHEIRTPMNAIMGFSDLLDLNFDNKKKLKLFSDIIGQRCHDLLDIINDILDISKIESGQLSVNIEECDLNELFADLNSFFAEHQNRFGKQNISFHLQAQCNSFNNIIITDKVKLKQIFINLISNAFKFTDIGKIEGGCKFDENHKLLFYVSDTGIGIPADKQKIIFDRFTQLQADSKKNTGGTGLGLSIVKGLIGLLGGEVFLESEPAKGSTFSFSFPYKIATVVHGESCQLEATNVKTVHNKVILIVEDDSYNAEYLKEILSNSKLTVLLAENGKTAIEMSISNPVDLVLMDVRLPDIDGYEVTRQIRQYKPDLKIIAQTAYAAQDERQKALDAGCNDYISKPTKKELLFTIVNKQLSL